MTLQEINTKYPIRNPVWTFDELTGRWIVESSELSFSGKNLDPWGRRFPTNNCKRQLWDSTFEEIVGWVYETTVAGVTIECVVFND